MLSGKFALSKAREASLSTSPSELNIPAFYKVKKKGQAEWNEPVKGLVLTGPCSHQLTIRTHLKINSHG